MVLCLLDDRLFILNGPKIEGWPNVQHLARSYQRRTDAPVFCGTQSVVAVLDDDELVRTALVRLLDAAGHTARSFSSGQDFLAAWHFDPPDCLVLDLQMPGLSGLEVQQALNKAGAKFPVIIITAHDAAGVGREEAMSQGAVAYLRKPVDAGVLLEAVMFAATRLEETQKVTAH